jgi:chromosome segregation ATPase
MGEFIKLDKHFIAQFHELEAENLRLRQQPGGQSDGPSSREQQLAADLNTVKNDLAVAAKDLLAARSELLAARNDLGEAERHCEALQRQSDQFRKQAADDHRRAEESEDRLVEVRRELDRTKVQAMEGRESRAESELRLRQLQSEYDELQSRLDRVTRERDEAVKPPAEMPGKSEISERESDKERNEVKDYEFLLAEKDRLIFNLRSELQGLKKQIFASKQRK